ncbi:glycosyl hydrolase family 8 [Paenibacillus sp. 481]|uniref:glycosyl hydrolase family 8 n=1 Tax=Paenibacillus sp. 481 TaxID=2835869 RepID=UPI001E4349D6|nr:glycosyl hydrolase family 8 [Paenibacillus sp. 481]UHA74809.1 beta-glucanase [Paenibacillus sp. 481]
MTWKKTFIVTLSSLLLMQTLLLSTPASASPAHAVPPQSVADTVYGQNVDEANVDALATPMRSFPQHVQYASGIIKPNHVSQSQLDQEVRKLYNQWKSTFLTKNPYNGKQYFVHYNLNGAIKPTDIITTSEAHGYGMIATAYMAGHDPEAKKLFDGLYHYYRAHPSQNHPDLMAWQQANRGGKIIDVGGTNSATDGDMDIAYALLLAEKQWGNRTGIDYGRQARQVIKAIMQKDVHQTNNFLKLGDWAQDSDPKYGKGTRPADFMLQHLKAFQSATGDSRWNNVIDATHKAMKDLSEGFAPQTGLLPDFAILENGKWKPSPPSYLEKAEDPLYYYNSARTPWRLGTDVVLTGDQRYAQQLHNLNGWIMWRTGSNPALINGGGYNLDGNEYIKSTKYYDLTFTAPFAVSAMISGANQDWLNKLWSNVTTQPTSRSNYFGDSIRLLSVIVVSGNWWSPN